MSHILKLALVVIVVAFVVCVVVGYGPMHQEGAKAAVDCVIDGVKNVKIPGGCK